MSLPSQHSLIHAQAHPPALGCADKPHPRPAFVPKFFGWVHSTSRSISREIAGEPFEPLSKEEVNLLSIYFARAIIEHLDDICRMRPWHREASSNTQNRKLLREITGVSAAMLAPLKRGLLKLESGELVPFKVDRLLRKNIRTATYFLFRLSDAWRQVSPAVNFMLLGGLNALETVLPGPPSDKVLSVVICELAVKGARPDNYPNKLNGFSRDSFSPDTLKRAKEDLSKAPDHPWLFSGSAPIYGLSLPHLPTGTAPVPTRKGTVRAKEEA